jgi:LmbE family N-acetylglucosaminyl deacetylase
MNLLLSPHNDDECLFVSYTLIREKPLVVIITDSDLQIDFGVTAEHRREESRRGCELLGVPVVFLGLKDGSLNEADLTRRLKSFNNLQWKRVYAPAIQGGHPDHDLIGKVAFSVFHRVSLYATYALGEKFSPVGEEVSPTQNEIDLKNKALDCYASQIGLIENKKHFDAVRGKPEYLISPQ